MLNEAGRLALGYAERIFRTSVELATTVRQGRGQAHLLHVGTVATLSRNFQELFINPLLGQPDLRLRLHSGSLTDLLGRLSSHELDLVLSNRRPQRDPERGWRCRLIARQPVSLIGHSLRPGFRFPEDLSGVSLIVPGPESDIRMEFDALCEQLGVPLRIRAEVDDMATMRLLARDVADTIALLPSVVVRDELREGILHECCVVPGLFETFYAITVERHYPHPLLQSLLARDLQELLASERDEASERDG